MVVQKSIGGHKDVEIYTALAVPDNLSAGSYRLKLVFWLCSGILCMTEWVFGLAAGCLVLMGIIRLFFDSTSSGMALVRRADCQPVWTPMLALKVVMLVDTASEAIRDTYIESNCLQNSS